MSFNTTVKNTIYTTALDINSKGFDLSDSIDFVEKVARMWDAKNTLAWLAEYCDSADVKDALQTVADFLAVADNEKSDIINALGDYDRDRQDEIHDYALKVAAEYYGTLTDKAKTLLNVCENVKGPQDLANLVLPDVNDVDDIDRQLYKDLVEYELLFDVDDKTTLYL